MTTRILRRALGAFMLAVFLLYAPEPVQAQEVQTHTVQQGETLYGIAQQYGLSLDELRELNDLEGDVIRVGQELVVSTVPLETTEPEEEVEIEAEPVQIEEGEVVEPGVYRAGTGDTFFSIAERLEVSVDELARLNEELLLRPLEAGDIVQLPEAVHTQVVHVVESGQNLTSIAQQYGVSVAEIREANNLEGDVIGVGQELIIRSEAPPEEEEVKTFEGPVATYPGPFAGRLTASGDAYDPEQFTASHPDLSFGTVVLLTNPATGRKSFARINDRGPVDRDLIMEVSDAIARALELDEYDEQPITVRVVE